MDRTDSAVEYRQRLRDELAQLLSVLRPDQFTLIELNALLDIMRPAAARTRQRHAPPGRRSAAG